MTDKQDPIAHAARLLREAAEELRQAHAYNNSEGWENETDAKAAYDEHLAAAQALEDWEAAVGAGGVSGPLMGIAAPPTAQAEGWMATAQHQTYRCKIKSRKQIDKEIPKDQQGWWAEVAAGKKLLLRPAVQADIDRCHLGPCRSKNPDDYMCETQTNGSLVSKIALEYMHPEQNVFAAVPPPPTSAEGVEHG